MKICTKCKKNLPFSDFYVRNDGKISHRSHCKKCISNQRKNYMEQYYQMNKERIKDTNKKYRKQYYIKNKAKINIQIKKYNQTVNGKISIKKHHKKYCKNNPLKIKARRFINNLLQNSNFTRDMCCICGEPNAEFHHENYDLPYFGYWFCVKHHKEIHKGVL